MVLYQWLNPLQQVLQTRYAPVTIGNLTVQWFDMANNRGVQTSSRDLIGAAVAPLAGSTTPPYMVFLIFHLSVLILLFQP
jgi:hypothetical protein